MTFPLSGANISETALTLSTVPRTSPAFTTLPTFGSSTYTTSVSSDCAKSVIPTVARFPWRRTHSWSFVYLRSSGIFDTVGPPGDAGVRIRGFRGRSAALPLRAPGLMDPDVLVPDLPDMMDDERHDQEEDEPEEEHQVRRVPPDRIQEPYDGLPDASHDAPRPPRSCHRFGNTFRDAAPRRGGGGSARRPQRGGRTASAPGLPPARGSRRRRDRDPRHGSPGVALTRRAREPRRSRGTGHLAPGCGRPHAALGGVLPPREGDGWTRPRSRQRTFHPERVARTHPRERRTLEEHVPARSRATAPMRQGRRPGGRRPRAGSHVGHYRTQGPRRGFVAGESVRIRRSRATPSFSFDRIPPQSRRTSGQRPRGMEVLRSQEHAARVTC